VHHSDRGSQYVSIKNTERLASAGVEPSVGSVGDSYDNALAETIKGSTKRRLFIDADLGGVLRPSSSPRWTGSTGSTNAAYWSRSAISRQPKPKNVITPRWCNPPWRRDLMKSASGKPGAVQSPTIAGRKPTETILAKLRRWPEPSD
jgi:hypothetical protein